MKSSWYNSYLLKYNCDNNLSNINNYINILNNKSNIKNIENKINQIEVDYHNKLKDISYLCDHIENVEIIKKSNSLIILQKELDIIKLLTKYTLQNKNLNYDFLINCLNIIYNLSDHLRKKIGQKEINNSNDSNKDSITRCSYKFCSYQDNCTYNYNLKIKNLCYQDHYVHNMVSADLKNLINYIKNKYENTKIILHNKEILKTINTLSYVIGHMELELRTKCLYSPENEWENNHIVKYKN
jgi:hypothetical protein